MDLKQEIIENLFLITGTHPSGIDVTSTIILSGRQATVVDSLFYPNETLRLLQSLRTEAKNLMALVNTHWHLDHTAGNNFFNVRIVAHKQCLELMNTKLPVQLKLAKTNYPEQFEKVEIKYPDQTFEKQVKLELGEKGLALMHLPGHTPDSIVGHLKDERILIAGDTVMELPFIGYGDCEKLINSLTIIQKMDVKTIIQGHGGLCEKSRLSEDIKYLETTRRIAKEYTDSGKSVDEVLKLPIELFLPPHRVERLHDAYKTFIHKNNVSKICEELTHPEKFQ